MAIYSLSVSCVKRSEGGSALAAAAYLEDRLMYDARLDKQYRFGSDKSEKHLTTVCLGSRLPDRRPIDTQRLWNAAEGAEKRSNSQPARKIMIALPVELTQEQQIEAINNFRTKIEERYGVATTAAIHYEHKHNPHAHIMITTREISQEADKIFFGKKTRILDDRQTGREEIEKIREAWEIVCNRELERAHEKARIDRRSYKRQGLNITPQIHLGMKAYALERKGIYSDRVEEAIKIEKQRSLERKLQHDRTNYSTRTHRHTQENQKLTPRPGRSPDRSERRDGENRIGTEKSFTDALRDTRPRQGERNGSLADLIEAGRTRGQNNTDRTKTLQEILKELDQLKANREIKTVSQLLEEQRNEKYIKQERSYSLDFGNL